jgi:hypothetical protein
LPAWLAVMMHSPLATALSVAVLVPLAPAVEVPMVQIAGVVDRKATNPPSRRALDQPNHPSRRLLAKLEKPNQCYSLSQTPVHDPGMDEQLKSKFLGVGICSQRAEYDSHCKALRMQRPHSKSRSPAHKNEPLHWTDAQLTERRQALALQSTQSN